MQEFEGRRGALQLLPQFHHALDLVPMSSSSSSSMAGARGRDVVIVIVIVAQLHIGLRVLIAGPMTTACLSARSTGFPQCEVYKVGAYAKSYSLFNYSLLVLA